MKSENACSVASDGASSGDPLTQSSTLITDEVSTLSTGWGCQCPALSVYYNSAERRDVVPHTKLPASFPPARVPSFRVHPINDLQSVPDIHQHNTFYTECSDAFSQLESGCCTVCIRVI